MERYNFINLLTSCNAIFPFTLSILWSVNKDLAITRNNTLFQLLILTFLVYNSIDDELISTYA